MLYSVWNKSTGTYSIYESLALPVPSSKRGSNLGAAPDESLDLLPPESEYVGESETAEGQIVRQPSRLFDFAMIVIAYVTARWLYEHFMDWDR